MGFLFKNAIVLSYIRLVVTTIIHRLKIFILLLAFTVTAFSLFVENTIYSGWYLFADLTYNSSLLGKKKTPPRLKFNLIQVTVLRKAVSRSNLNPTISLFIKSDGTGFLYGLFKNRKSFIFGEKLIRSLDYIKLVLSRSPP
jgi:hypothetical protein